MNQQQQSATARGQSAGRVQEVIARLEAQGTTFIEIPENEDDLIVHLGSLLERIAGESGPIVIAIRVDVHSTGEHSISKWHFRRPASSGAGPGQWACSSAHLLLTLLLQYKLLTTRMFKRFYSNSQSCKEDHVRIISFITDLKKACVLVQKLESV